ncbi:alpha/beta fold hydrolase [Acidothermus cellulolyticus]|uniref:alpha/beta fold hydrolase n=1 Tax=Acidothermus cellulolyticus TaxID=28049 RepID=UPI0002ED072A|nr:alpha/beta fold hydrolase [Acidothermus cellulolyticus]
MTTTSPVSPPLVLLPAFPFTARMWDRVRPLLAATGVDVVTPDYRGAHDPAQLDGVEPSLDVLADDVVTLLDDRGVGQAIVGGVSMGGYVTMALARRHPERLAGVILADTRATADDETTRANRLAIAAQLEADGRVDVLVEKTLPGLPGATTKAERPELLAELQAITASVPAVTAAWWQRAMAVRPDSTETLRRLRVPALVIVGAEDVVSPPDAAAAMAMAVPDGRLVTIPAAGHLTPIEAPELFAGAVAGFVTELVSAAR